MFYHSNNGSYTGSTNNFCATNEAQAVIQAIQATGALAACYIVPTTGGNSDGTIINLTAAERAALQKIDWAISVWHNNTAYSVNSSGVVTFDSTDTRGLTIGDVNNWASTGWDTASATYIGAMEACAMQGKKLPSTSQLKALDMAWTGSGNARPVGVGTPFPFTEDSYWSSGESATPGFAYSVTFDNGNGGRSNKTSNRYVRCVS